jgi:hypothetical protein
MLSMGLFCFTRVTLPFQLSLVLSPTINFLFTVLVGENTNKCRRAEKNPTICARNYKFRAAGFDKTAIKLTQAEV